MNQKELFDIANSFRKVIESMPVDERPLGLKKFPAGACGDCSILLGAYLKDLGVDDFKYICGERGAWADNTWESHAWLQKGSVIIDITADQFPGNDCKVIVSGSSAWHSLFETAKPTESDFRLKDSYTVRELRSVYESILTGMGRSFAPQKT